MTSDPTPMPRLAPQLALPARAFVPGRTERPAEGWLRELGAGAKEADLADPAGSLAFRYGCDLFHEGFLWEAHEAWEGLWQLARRRPELADEATLLRALIQIAAAALQERMDHPAGVVRIRERAEAALTELASHRERCLGVDLLSLRASHTQLPLVGE